MSRGGFTLIELLVVVAIIGMLSSVVLASLNGAREESRDARRLQDLHQIQNALELYSVSNGKYPSTSDAWVGSWQAGSWLPELAPTYFPKIPLDPINNESRLWLYYYYISNGSAYCLQIPQEGNCQNDTYFSHWEVHSGIPNTCMLRTGEYPNCL